MKETTYNSAMLGFLRTVTPEQIAELKEDMAVYGRIMPVKVITETIAETVFYKSYISGHLCAYFDFELSGDEKWEYLTAFQLLDLYEKQRGILEESAQNQHEKSKKL